MASRGLPANPRPRTKSTGALAPNRPPVQHRALPTNPRARPPQSQRERVQESTTTPFASRWNSPAAQSANIGARRTLDHSPSSSTSSSSSMRTRGTSSLASSRTTLPSEEVNSQYLDGGYGARAERNNDHPPNDVKDGVGFSWDKVTEVATVFTQEVSKVWATGLNPLIAGDVAAGESELTRVMRAYHLSKARNPSELPKWLFSERERGQLGGLLRTEVPSDDSQARPPRGQRNHLEIGEMSAPRAPERRLKNIQNFPTPINKLPPTKTSGVDRLKMMRERRTDRL